MTATTLPGVREDYRLEFRCRTPISVGGAGADAVTDLPLATDGQGRVVIPGSSWAGVLRVLARRVVPGRVDAVFGPECADEGHASRLSVFDTPVTDPEVELRTGVGIDRRSGTAAVGLLYDRSVLPPGTLLVLHLRYEGPDEPAVHELVRAVRAAGLRIGAGSTRGLGRLECRSAERTRAALGSRQEVLAMLAGQAKATDVPAAETGPQQALRISLEWRPRRAVLIGSGDGARGADVVPLLTAGVDGTGLVPVVPGASVKGVLRSAAERAIRTVLPGAPMPTGDAVASQTALAEAVPVLDYLFGSRHRSGALSVADVAAAVPALPRASWRDPDAALPQWGAERTHVAIDRWTGGAADGLLFTVLEPRVWAWSPIELELDVHRLAGLGERGAVAATVLLGVAVADLLEGRSGLGRGSTRGLGEIEVRQVDVHGAAEAGLPEHRGGEWWAWLREVAAGRGLDELLTEGMEP